MDNSLVITFPIAINRHHEGGEGSEESKLREIVPRGSEHEAVVAMKSHQCQSISHLKVAQERKEMLHLHVLWGEKMIY